MAPGPDSDVDHRCTDKVIHRVQHQTGPACAAGVAWSEESFDSLQRAAVSEDAQPTEHLLLCLIEQLKGPIDGRVQSGMPRIDRASVGQHIELAVEPSDQPVDSQHRRSRGRKLERERQPVEAASDVLERVQRDGRQVEVAAAERNPMSEELNCGTRPRLVAFGRASRERWDTNDLLAADPERLPRRDEGANGGAGGGYA